MSGDPRLTHAALDTAAHGWPVHPLIIGGKRTVFHSEKNCPGTGACAAGHATPEHRATTDPHRIRTCWAAGPFNIGLATGPAGLIVIDLDVPKRCTRGETVDGHATFARLCTEHDDDGTAWDTRTVRTARGGTHLYYQAPPDSRLGNTAGHLGPGIDTRAHGGHVVAPGSITPHGVYLVEVDREPAILPTWLHQLLTPKPPTARTERTQIAHTDRLPGYVRNAVERECDRVRTAQPGTHATVLFTAAIALGQLVGTGVLPPGTAIHHLETAAESMAVAGCSCTPREIARTVRNGLARGVREPRRLPTRERTAV